MGWCILRCPDTTVLISHLCLPCVPMSRGITCADSVLLALHLESICHFDPGISMKCFRDTSNIAIHKPLTWRGLNTDHFVLVHFISFVWLVISVLHLYMNIFNKYDALLCEHWLKIALRHIESHCQSCLPSTGAVLYNMNFPIVVAVTFHASHHIADPVRRIYSLIQSLKPK